MSSITPEEVCKFKKPTDGFLCKLSDNIYGIDFLAFTIKDYDTKRKIFHVDRCVRVFVFCVFLCFLCVVPRTRVEHCRGLSGPRFFLFSFLFSSVLLTLCCVDVGVA